MRRPAVFVAVLLSSVLASCDFIMPGASKSGEDEVEAQSAPVPVDVVAEAKATGIVIYEGGSRGVEVPKPLEYYIAPTGAAVIAGTVVDPASSNKTGGASFAVPEDAENRFSGKTINIKVVSSAAQAGEARLAYSTNEVGNSGWLTFPVTTEDSVATLTYAVAPKVEGLGDFIGIDPNGTELTIKAIVVDVVE